MESSNNKENKYASLIENEQYDLLANPFFESDLIDERYKYNNKYLIEYLLEKKIHSEKMDNYLVYNDIFAKFYLQYNLIEPLLSCSLNVLLSYYNNELLLDIILDKLNREDINRLYNNIRKNSFHDYFVMESDIINIFLRHGIVLPIVFVTTEQIEDDTIINKEDQDLLNNFREIFKDTNYQLLEFILKVFKKGLIKNHDRTINDIKRIISYKNSNPDFRFILSENFHDSSFDLKDKIIKAEVGNSPIFNHELSHLFYQVYESDPNILIEYESIRKKIDTIEYHIKFKEYINKYHVLYHESRQKYELLYNNLIVNKYGSKDNYIEKLYLDLKENTPSVVALYNTLESKISYPIITEFNLRDIVETIIDNEKEEFIAHKVNDEFKEYKMLENLLDALLFGKIFDNLKEDCLSGHGSLYFSKVMFRSFDECLADYEGLKKENSVLVDDLKDLVGLELTNFLDNYIKKNRGSYGR